MTRSSPSTRSSMRTKAANHPSHQPANVSNALSHQGSRTRLAPNAAPASPGVFPSITIAASASHRAEPPPSKPRSAKNARSAMAGHHHRKFLQGIRSRYFLSSQPKPRHIATTARKKSKSGRTSCHSQIISPVSRGSNAMPSWASRSTPHWNPCPLKSSLFLPALQIRLKQLEDALVFVGPTGGLHKPVILHRIHRDRPILFA